MGQDERPPNEPPSVDYRGHLKRLFAEWAGGENEKKR